MWTDENRLRYDRSGLRYTHDLTDEEWAEVEPLIPPAKPGGNKRTVNIREIVIGLMYILGSGRHCHGNRVAVGVETGETGGMKPPSNPHYRHRFPAKIISHAVWLYHVFSLSFRDVELLLAQRGIVVSYETVRRWCKKFGQNFACRLPPPPTSTARRQVAPR